MLVLALVAAACANADASQKPANPAQLRQSAKALSHIHSFGFHATVTLNLNTGKATALEISGHVAKSGASEVFDANFRLENSMLPITGELRAPGGHTVYLKLPALLGAGWKSYILKPMENSRDVSSAAVGLKRLNPFSLLTNVTRVDGGGVRTFSADLDPAKLVAAVESLAAGSRQSHARQIAKLGSALTIAHGSVSVDMHTHLPTSVSAELGMNNGAKHGYSRIDVTFDGWNQPVKVSVPSGATPLKLSSSSMLTLSGIH